MDRNVVAVSQHQIGYEIVDAKELAALWRVPESWVREQSRSRASDPIPHVKLGRYVRYELGSPAIEEWWARHRRMAPAGKKPVSNAQSKH